MFFFHFGGDDYLGKSITNRVILSNIWSYEISSVHMACGPFCVTKTIVYHGHYRLQVNFSTKLFIPAMHIALLTSIILCHFTDLDLGWGSQGQHKAKPPGFIFSYTFHLIRLKFNMVLKHSS